MGILLIVGPIIAAFAAKGWDWRATVMPSEDQMSGVKDKIKGLFGGEFPEPQIVSSTVSPTEITATVNLPSPFSIDVIIENISGDIYCKQHSDVFLATVQIENGVEVDLPAEPGSATFTLVGAPASGAYQHIVDNHGGNLPDITSADMVIELKFYGVTVRVENMRWG